MPVTVSIILPTYNRARFLPPAFRSIVEQHFTDWELIIVDDGSTDDTPEIVSELTRNFTRPVTFIRQQNSGAYGARNTGLDHVRGRYVAFFDSDDRWLPHHLKNCVDALDANSDLDWVYGACRIVDEKSEAVLVPHTFYQGDRETDFLRLPAEHRRSVSVLREPRLVERILDGAGLFAGLQNSVIKTNVFKSFRFNATPRNEAEDQLFVIWALSRKYVIGYLNDVHVVYCVHSHNSSGSATGHDARAKASIYRAVVEGYRRLPDRVALTRRENVALRRRIANESFWRLGYGTLLVSGDYRAALGAFAIGLIEWPWSLRMWKAVLGSIAKGGFASLSRLTRRTSTVPSHRATTER